MTDRVYRIDDLAAQHPRWIRKIRVQLVDGVTAPGECWLWHGADNGKGYGLVYVNKLTQYLHRYAYQLLVGPIPEGLQLDHLCRQVNCCAPHHLEPVTGLTNTRRGLRASQTLCLRSHPLAGDNVYLWADPKHAGRVHRICRTCRDERKAVWDAQRKARQS